MQFTDLQLFQHFDKYSKVVDGKRTNYIETVSDTLDFLFQYFEIKNESLYNDLFGAISSMDIFPSLRLLNQTPKAIERDNTVIYNCSALHANSWHSIASILYLSMSGVGVGIGIEQHTVNQLPTIRPLNESLTEILIVEDSQFGWASAFWQLLDLSAKGVNVLVDISNIRPAGAVLKTKNGVASGPEPLKELFDFSKKIINNARGRKLTVTEVADIVTKIGDAAVSGGARRSALILLGDNTDEFVKLKYSGFYNNPEHKHRSNSNNSIIIDKYYHDQEEFNSLLYAFNSENGEPGFFSRHSVLRNRPDRRYLPNDVLTNPCAEISLRPDEFCNLTQVNLRSNWTVDKFYEMIELSTILGTIQSMFDNFAFIGSGFRRNAIEERLLGVGLSNIFAAQQFSNPRILAQAKFITQETNKKWANYFGIAPSAANTTIKPAGNSTALANLESPGLHPAFGKYVRRNVAIESFTPMGKFLQQKNWPMVQHPYKKESLLAQFYEYSNGTPTAKDVSAIQHLNTWLMYKKYWAEHNVSCSIYYSKDEVPAIQEWMFRNQHDVNGISFMPRQDYDYPFAPIEVIDKEEFERSVAAQPKINWDEFRTFDVSNHVQKRVVECSGDSCVFISE